MMGYDGDSMVRCLRCGKVGKRKDLDLLHKKFTTGHCGFGDLVYVKKVEE